MSHLFCNWKVVLLNVPHLLLLQSPAPLANTCLFSKSITVSILFVHLFYCLDSTFKWNYTVSVFLWFISLSIIPSRAIHVILNGKISFFFFFLLSFVFLGLHLWHMEVPRLRVKSELLLPTYSHSNARSKLYLRPIPQLTATPDP